MMDLKLELSQELFDEMTENGQSHKITINGIDNTVTPYTDEEGIQCFRILKLKNDTILQEEYYTVPGVLELC